ncbi:methylenetetrahydrofolate--tRNA-(uracil(54)-C(5))-methyltransferase (FADH(2)-oxidizing) TrmFO [Caldisericum exile]|uniref:Methylenetetrahydrofolate--tRNA-(uracil-5-)-methyltransferase TrmFO n=1 Tax=Caldisericum exile (strain DSM 21853 / NBRC 104410 / AZM16c01) TaxID=511051 RepID=A0A7U6GFD2_CALEA|nr:methylenetetrahydrofolate--tRNA-(uracil(54)-C(5))-methyltransferase (FADH(2)-oxidizing) TrmFO [Caldisericum exile]BAL81392.1 methylenetetrahydrofolate--tRNA-(uracil-5-)-methyltransferase TrmFO [Caldisericum exile AZM16c01]
MKVVVIGGGLAGSEAALQIAEHSIDVILYEMRPGKLTEAHRTGNFAELVCSNSLGSIELTDARGLLKEEGLKLGSILLQIAYKNRVPAGKALAVDRVKFSEEITNIILNHPKIHVERAEVTKIDFENDIVVIASGPLTSDALLNELQKLFGENLFFYDAISPVVTRESLDLTKMFFGGRYNQSPDYLNIPLTYEEYTRFHKELIEAKTHTPHDFDKVFFESCLPIEEIARRGFDALRFGPLTPKGFSDNYFAVVQLRREDVHGNLFELVGFQTSLTYPEQKRVFGLLPGLENAEFVRYGSIHKNAYFKANRILLKTLQTRKYPNIFLAGQITGSEGYSEAILTGLVAGLNVVRLFNGKELLEIGEETMIGSLIRFLVENDLNNPQPMRANFGLIPKKYFEIPKSKRKEIFINDSLNAIEKLRRSL